MNLRIDEKFTFDSYFLLHTRKAMKSSFILVFILHAIKCINFYHQNMTVVDFRKSAAQIR